ncbi:MAG: GrpB family protein [Hyphomicrobium sp.]|nr:GrpB family protein [Hyphomicrobium sp.]
MSVEPDFSLHPDPALARAAAQDLFERTATMLRSLLPASADIRHIGATAIPGCLTKGDLDIVVRVEAADFAGADAALAAHFDRNTGSTHSDTFSSFESDGTSPHLGVQLTVIGAPGDFFHTFAEALTRDPDLLTRYNALKRQFDGHPMDDYRAAKSAFITSVLHGAECS